ncbi:MAG: tetratricopeptide repeat protein [Gammaproteobacteria bacterium]
MASRTYACALAAAVVLLGAGGAQAEPSTQKVEVKGLRDASKWYRVETQHFVLYSDTRRDDVVELLNSLERLDYLLRVYTKPFLTGQAAAQKVTLYFHDRTGWLAELGGKRPADAIGLYNSCASGVQAFAFNIEPVTALKNEQLAKGTLNEGLSYIFEGYARHFIYRYTDIRSPASFIDGFAQYFSSARFTDNQMVVGRVPQGVGRFMHLLDDGYRYRLRFADILDHRDPKKADEAAVQIEFQARSWNLMHFMLSSEENRAKLATYLSAVNEGTPVAQAFASAYGLSGDAVDQALWRYRQPGVKVVRVDIPELPQARLEFAEMSEATGDFLLQDAKLKACPGKETGEALLRSLRAEASKVPNNEFAQLTLARAQVEWGNPRDALAYLNAATKRDSRKAEAWYLLGAANLRLAQVEPTDARPALLAAAQRSLAQAASLAPASPEVQYALFKAGILATSEPDKASVARAIVAWRNAHEVNTFARSAALAYAWLGDPAGSFRALNVVANNVRDPDSAAWARTWMGKLNTGVSRADLVAEMRREPAPADAFKEWTVASVDVMDTLYKNVGLEKAQGYLDSQVMGDPSQPDRVLQNVPVRSGR